MGLVIAAALSALSTGARAPVVELRVVTLATGARAPVLELPVVKLAPAPPAPADASAAPAIALGYRIQIPRLAIDLPIQEGDVKRDVDDQRTPEGWAFHLPGTAIPGQGGNTYLYAHARRGMFLSLWNARSGDEVFVSTPDGGVLVYLVRDVLPAVAPGDVSVAAPTRSERLTLQTSTGPNAADPRFVVVAYPRGS